MTLRREYQDGALRRADLHADPFFQLREWIDEADAQGVLEPNAFILATSSKEGKPSSRTLLAKEITSSGLLFFTNYNSRKAQELTANPFASGTFFWPALERQATIEGTTEPLTKTESEAYWTTRPRGSQLSAWASQQGAPLASRTQLESQLQQVSQRFAGAVPMPPNWGGFRLKPSRIEFWQGRLNRLHDRFHYLLQGNSWVIERISP